MVPFLFFWGRPFAEPLRLSDQQAANARYSGRAVNGRMMFTHHLRDTSP